MMRMKFRIVLIIILTSIIFGRHVFALNTFVPWDSPVKVGDENVSMIPENADTAHRFELMNNFYIITNNTAVIRIRPVYNGFQGGAYFLIRFFQICISPQDGPNCRYHPVCSAYGRQAVQKYGALTGSILIGDRLLRCNPFGSHGSDPLPVKLFGGKE